MSSPENPGKKEARHRRIQVLLIDANMMRVQELCEELGCSEATLRNDLRELEAKGLVKRTFGGVLSTGNTLGTTSDHQKLHRREKNAIARYVVSNILKNGQTIILDMGTTALMLAQNIAHSNLRLDVVTNSLAAVNTLAYNDQITLHVPGGTYDRNNDTFDVSSTIEYYRNIHADYFFMVFNGISLEAGFTVPTPNWAALKAVVIKQSRKTIALADHSKVNKLAFRKVCDFSDVDMLIVDGGCSDEEREYLQQTKMDIRYAPLED